MGVTSEVGCYLMENRSSLGFETWRQRLPGAVDRRPDGSRVEEIHLEQPEARVRAVQGQQVLRLALIICKEGKN